MSPHVRVFITIVQTTGENLKRLPHSSLACNDIPQLMPVVESLWFVTGRASKHGFSSIKAVLFEEKQSELM